MTHHPRRKPYYQIRHIIEKELDLEKQLFAQSLAGEVLSLYNQNKEKDPVTKTSIHFYNALDAIWKKHHFHDQRTIHAWHDKKVFNAEIIPWCHCIQPRTSNKKALTPNEEKEYKNIVAEEITYLFSFKRYASDTGVKSFIYALQETWRREHATDFFKSIWASYKSFKEFYKEYFYYHTPEGFPKTQNPITM